VTESDDKQRHAAHAVGRALAGAAAWVGRKAASAYHMVDPDLRLHLAQLPLVGLTQLAPGQRQACARPADGHRPVVFVHGLGGGPGNLLPMRTFFLLNGRKRAYAPQLPPGRSLPELGTFLAGFVDEVAVTNGLAASEQIDVVAHSMGGLIARLALEDERTRARVATLVTMGTPHSGSHLARYGARAYSLALRPDSEVLARLGRQLPWPGPPAWPRLVALWSPADVILLPATSACVEGAENVELPGFTHYSYLLDLEAWRRVYRLLGEG